MAPFDRADSIKPDWTAASQAHDSELGGIASSTMTDGGKEGLPDESTTPSIPSRQHAKKTQTLPKIELQRAVGSARGWDLAHLAFQAVGVVYGDIGTSPLYVLNGIFASDGPVPPEEDVIGVISAIVWLFTLVVMFKYALIVLRFGTGMGEGGTFALYQGLFPRSLHDDDDDDEGHGRTAQLTMTTRSIGGLGRGGLSVSTERRSLLLRYGFVKPLLCGWALFGSALTIADGILTPAVSVVSAAEGIAVVKPSLQGSIVPIAIAILVGLVLLQSFGIRRLTIGFSPAVFIWLLFLAITGAVNCASFPGIWRAWDPSRAVMYFVRTGNYDALSGILLSITGCEALFANLGQLGRSAIVLPLCFVVYPSLMLAYLGQGAKLVSHGAEVLPNLFYLTIPGGQGNAVYWIGFATGLLATIIASQAMLTACFSIVSQLVHMRSFPSVAMKFPNNNFGQAYVPVVNWLLAVAIVAVVGGFQSSANLTEAYGFAVVTVMLVTTTEVALSIYFVKRRPWILAVVFFVFFGFIDALLWGSTLRKIPEGAWFSLSVGSGIAIFLCLWTYLTSLVDNFDKANRLLLTDLVSKTEESKEEGSLHGGVTRDGPQASDFAQDLILRSLLDGGEKRMPRSTMVSVFWKPSGGRGVPHSFSHFLSKYPCCPGVVIFLSLRTLAVPSIPMSSRVVMDRVRSYPGFYSATVRQGYKDVLELEGLDTEFMRQIRELEHMACTNSKSEAEINAFLDVAQKTVTHIYPSYYLAARFLASSLRAKFPDLDMTAKAALSFLAASPRALVVTTWDLMRVFLIEGLYRRARGAFAEEDGPFDAREEIIRVVVTASV